jgi:sortase A
MRIVEPTEVSILDPTSTPVLTLYTCYPYGIDTHRIVVTAQLVVD